MRSYLSLYIHLFRIFAAMGVFLAHVSLHWFSNGGYFPGGKGHYCVIIFFVLSGYLIAYTQDVGQKSFKNYSIDRLSRLYSVVLPALLATYILDGIGQFFNPLFYTHFLNKDYQWLKFILNFGFLQQINFINTNPSSNNVFWSLSYEFWYYVFFACIIYLKGKWRLVAASVCLFIMGIKILLLLPIWLMGVGVYSLSKKNIIPNRLAIVLFIGSFFVFWALFMNSVRIFPNFGLGFPPFYYSGDFANDYLFGILMSINLLALSYVKVNEFILPLSVEKIIRLLSVATFPLYTFHYPLLVLIRAVIPYDINNQFHLYAVMLVIIAIVLFITHYLDKSRKYYIAWFDWAFQKLIK